MHPLIRGINTDLGNLSSFLPLTPCLLAATFNILLGNPDGFKLDVGRLLGTCENWLDGKDDDATDGRKLGDTVGLFEGSCVGNSEGFELGMLLGTYVGRSEGLSVGALVGVFEGDDEGRFCSLGLADILGIVDGKRLGK